MAKARSGLSRRELARRAGTSQATLAAYEQGRVNPSVAVLNRICEAAGLRAEVSFAPALPDVGDRGELLAQLLELAEAYPWADRGPLDAPVLAREMVAWP